MRMMRWFPAAILAVVLCMDGRAAGERFQPPEEEIESARAMLERILNENILAFWYPETIDEEGGGYLINHGEDGGWRGPTSKYLVTQARTVWFFSALVNRGYGGTEHLAAARHGYEFLRDRLQDKEHGGFHWELSREGEIRGGGAKRLYGQAFALYALSEFARASGDEEALGLARRQFELIDEYARDKEYGGYLDWVREDWSRFAEEFEWEGRDRPDPWRKTLNTHLHMLEAVSNYYSVSGDDRARVHLEEVMMILGTAVPDPETGAMLEEFAMDWSDRAGSDRVLYGHNVETLWLMLETCDQLGVSGHSIRELCERTFAYCLRYGYDREKGGFFSGGRLGSDAWRRDKNFWTQAEGLTACLSLYELTGEEVYWNAFAQTLDWIATYQVDWEAGEWFSDVNAEGQGRGSKANEWKGPYHNSRAVMNCLGMLEGMGG